MIYIYRLFYWVSKNLLQASSILLNQKMQQWISLRNSQDYKKFQSSNSVYWFHASSGEIEYVKPMIRELKTLLPLADIVVSYSSPSAKKLFNNIKNQVTLFFPLPWDNPEAMSDVFTVIKPKALIFARTDLWPELIYQAQKNKVPVLVSSYNPTLSAFNRLVTDLFFRPIQYFFCVYEEQTSELKKILPHATIITGGDTRFDQVFWRLKQESLVDLKKREKLSVWGSTWKEDDEKLISTLNWFKEQGYQIAWCPHEINTESMERIKKILAEKHLSYEIFSDFNLTENKQLNLIADVLILDKVGYLADLYRYADLAFVGGSFRSKVHSVMEPLCCGLPILTGPYIQNNPEALKYSKVLINSFPMVHICTSEKDLLQALEKTLLIDATEYKKIILSQIEKNKGLAQKQVQFILQQLRN